MDDTQKRLDAFDVKLAEIKAFLTIVATKPELERLRGDLGAQLGKARAILPYLATKADVAAK